MSGAILGLDLSLKRSAFCRIPSTWNPGEWNSVHTGVIPGEGVGIQRISTIVEVLYQVARKVAFGDMTGHVFVEQHAFAMAGGAFALERAELVGAMKLKFYQSLDLVAVPVVASSARKTLFGKLPRMKRAEWKKFVVHELQKMGAPWDDDDTCDAFVIANHGRGEVGLPVLSVG
jgi:hypothetical protein